MAYINFTKNNLNPYSKETLNEGQFSWMTQDTDQQIGSERQNTIDVWMYDNEGNQWFEKRYEGYGVFGNMDYFELLAKMNGYTEEDLVKTEEMRDIGIDIAYNKKKTKVKGGKVLFPALVATGKFNWKRHDFTVAPEDDENQSWYQEEEYDEYDEKFDASTLEEGAMSDIHMFAQEAKDLADFTKKFFKEFGDKIKKTADSMKWLEELYTGMVDESVITEKVKSWNDVAKIMDAGLKKASVSMSYAKDYVKSLEAMTKKDAKKFFADYGNFTEDDFIEDVEYNMANESKLTWDSLKESLGLTEAKFNKKSLMKAMKADDGMVQLGNGKEYVIYAYDNGNDDNDDMWGDKTIFGLDQDGEEHEIEYSDIVSYNESTVNEGRSINKISKDLEKTVLNMKKTVDEWKAAEGDRKSELLEKLRALNKTKVELEAELNDAVAGKDHDVQLALEEAQDLAYLELDVNNILNN